MEVKNRFTPSERIQTPGGDGAAQQQFKEDCDINSIMARFQKTGTVDHVAKFQPQYGIANPLSYQESLNVIVGVQQMFAELPSSIRDRFKQDPAEFLEFVQDPANLEEAEELGLKLESGAQAAAVALREKAAAEAAAAAAAAQAAAE